MNRLIVIVGPTASGKTDFSIWLAKEIRTDIISADSLQVYKEFNICTSKPTVEQLKQVDHHLVGHVPICDEYSVMRFVKEARSLIKRISSEGKIPIIVGGTGLYIDALLNNFQFQQDCCENFSENIPNEDLYDTLRSLDPLAAKSIHRNDFKRLRRAINFFKTFNFSILDQKSNTMDAKKEFQVLKFGLNFRDRNLLYERINRRVDNMLERGLIEEIDRVRKKKFQKQLLPL